MRRSVPSPSDPSTLDAPVPPPDWAATPLGSPEAWPPRLKAAIDMLRACPLPMLLLWGPDLLQIYNEAYRRIAVPEPAAVAGQPLRDDPAQPLPLDLPLCRALVKGKGRAFERRMVIGGPHRGVEVSYSRFGEESGAADGVLVTLRQPAPPPRVVERTGAARPDETQQESAERLRLAVRASRSGSWDFDLKDGVGHWSPEAAAINGWPPDKNRITAEEWAQLIYPPDLERARATFIDAVAHGVDYSMDYRIVRPDGVVRWTAVQGSVLADAEGKPARLIGLVQDISERKAAEEALRNSEARFRVVLDNLPQPVWVVTDPEAGVEAIYYINQSWLDYTGFAPDEGRRWPELIDPADRVRHYAERAAGVAAGMAFEIQSRVRRHDGLYRWQSVRFTPLRNETGISAWLGSWTDIHDMRQANAALEQRVAEGGRALAEQAEARHRAEAALHQSQKLEAVGQLTGGVAHDFNNLLTVVAGSLDFIERLAAESDPIGRHVANARRAVEKGTSLISQLLAFARRQMLVPEVSHLDRLVGEFCGLVRRTLGESIAVEWRNDSNLWPCKIDPAQFQAALLNLAVNARDAMPRGGKLTIITRNAVISAASEDELALPPGRYVVIAMSDTGAGMPPPVAARAFEPFFTTKEPGRGTGLGLSQVHGFVHQSGGDVRLDSREGKGTTVTMMFPACDEADPVAAQFQEAAAPPAVKAATILVAEDDAQVLEVIRTALAAAGHRVLYARNGHEALALIEREPDIDLLLTDVVMPHGLSGVDLAKEAQHRRRTLRVLLMSGYPRDELALHGATGAFEFLPKPFGTRSLTLKVQALLSRS